MAFGYALVISHSVIRDPESVVRERVLEVRESVINVGPGEGFTFVSTRKMLKEV